MSEKKPRGYIEKVLFADCETSGMAFHEDDPSINTKTGEVYQSVSWGFIVANANTLKPIQELYLEIKWDGVSKWDKRAQGIHGLTLEHLEANGVTSEEAVEQIGELIIDHWGPEGAICMGGHNVATFDKWFLMRLFRSQGIELRFGSKHIDTNSIGFATFKTHNSDDLFEAVGLPARDPKAHNALTDARNALQTVRTVRSIFDRCIEGA